MPNAAATAALERSASPPALKDAALAALVAFGLFLLHDRAAHRAGPDRRARDHHALPDAWRSWSALVFVGAFLRALIFGRGPIPLGRARAAVAVAALLGSARPLRRRRRCSVFALLVPVLFYSNRYLLDLGILVLTYVMLGWGLNIVVGLAGLLDLGYVAFYAVGAYSYALLAHELRPVVLDLPAARRHPRRVLGHPARLSGAAAARRLSRHRHARLRRDHPPRAAQLAELHRRPERHLQHPAAVASSACRSTTTKAASPRPSASNSRRPTASSSCST